MKCINFKKYESGCLKGFADIEAELLGQTIILKCKLFQKDSRQWISLPDHQATNKEGEKIYVPNIYFKDTKDKHHVCEQIQKEVSRWIKENPQEDQIPQQQNRTYDECPF